MYGFNCLIDVAVLLLNTCKYLNMIVGSKERGEGQRWGCRLGLMGDC